MTTWLNEGPGLQSHERAELEDAIRICRDVYGGTLQMRREHKRYLPQFPKESPQVYEARCNAAVLYNLFKRTVRGLTGMVLRKPPKPDEKVPEPLIEHFRDIDNAGRNLSMFANDGLNEALIDMGSIVVVDMPRIADGKTRDEVAHMRPYWYLVRLDDLLALEHERRDGKVVFTELRWRDKMVEKDPADPFKQVARNVVKQFLLVADPANAGKFRVQWQSWVQREDGKNKKAEWQQLDMPTEMGAQMDEIPIAPIAAGDDGPPLLDLATENVRHFQKLSDKDSYEHVSCVSILTLIGAEEDAKELAVGPTVGLRLPKGASAQYTETSGNGSKATAESLTASEQRMAILGLSMLHSESRAAETATSKEIDKAETDSQLATAAEALEVALNNAKRLHCKWMQIEDDGVIAVNRDFKNVRMDASMLGALSALVPSKLSVETLWDLMEAGGILPDTFDPELEQGRLEESDEELANTLRKVMAQRTGTPAVAEDGEEGAAA